MFASSEAALVDAALVESDFMQSINTGMKATESEPSPKSLRNKLGNLKATPQASVTVRSKKAAKVISLNNPNTRLIIVPPAMAAAFKNMFSVEFLSFDDCLAEDLSDGFSDLAGGLPDGCEDLSPGLWLGLSPGGFDFVMNFPHLHPCLGRFLVLCNTALKFDN
jgi:hypothetical protein